MNFRFIDDILTLTGIIPTEKEYAMQYKTMWPTTVREEDTGQDHDTEWTREPIDAFPWGAWPRDAAVDTHK